VNFKIGNEDSIPFSDIDILNAVQFYGVNTSLVCDANGFLSVYSKICELPILGLPPVDIFL